MVSRASDVVVLENAIRSGTVLSVEQVRPKYELLPREKYTYQIPPSASAVLPGTRKISMSQYEALLELYQAQNAVQIARSLGVDQVAPDTYNRAVQLLRQAEELQRENKSTRSVVTTARAATESAEDAREVAAKKLNEKDPSSPK